MNAEESKRFIKSIFELDPDAAVDTSGPPNHSPFCVIFSSEANLNDEDLGNLSDWFRQLEYLNIGRTSVSGDGIANLTKSVTLKIVTIPFGLPIKSIAELFAIPTLRRVRIPLPSSTIENYRHLPDELTANDHITISRTSDGLISLKELYPNVWSQIE